MRRSLKARCATATLLFVCAAATWAADKENKPEATTIYEDKNPEGGASIGDWTKLLTDTAEGSVSAAGMLGISGESITTVNNLRDVVVGLKGLSTDGEAGTLAIALTPGRTDWAPIPFSTYVGNWWVRPLANITVGYAQGNTKITDVDFQRRAVSVETSVIFEPEEDLVVAYGRAYKNGGGACEDLYAGTPFALPGQVQVVPVVAEAKPGAADAPEPTPVPAPGVGAGTPQRSNAPVPPPVDEIPEVDTTAGTSGTDLNAESKLSKTIRANALACYNQVKSGLRWNAGRASVAYGQGWVRIDDKSRPEESLGRILAVSASYGFDGYKPDLSEGKDASAFDQVWAYLRKRTQLSITYRHSKDEPVLTTLNTDAIDSKDKDLISGRVAFGSSRARLLFEMSDAKSNSVTASERTFKQAVGIDYKVAKTLWLNLRFGKQRAIEGDEDEVGSLLSISYSPSALLELE